MHAHDLAENGLTVLHHPARMPNIECEMQACIDVRKKYMHLRLHQELLMERWMPNLVQFLQTKQEFLETAAYRLEPSDVFKTLEEMHSDAGRRVLQGFHSGLQFLKRHICDAYDISEMFLLITSSGYDQIQHADSGADAWGMMMYLQPTFGNEALCYIPDSHIKCDSYQERVALSQILAVDAGLENLHSNVLHKDYQTVANLAKRDRAAGRKAFTIKANAGSEEFARAPKTSLMEMLC